MSIVTTVKTAGKTVAFAAKKYAPEILTGTGIVGIVAAGVLGAKATLRLEAFLDEAETRLLRVKHNPAHTKKDLLAAYTKNVEGLLRLYGLPVTLGLASIASILAAHGIMRRRNAALAAAYAVLDKSFRAYRERVAEVIGKDEEQELYDGVRTQQTTGANGKKTTEVVRGDGFSPYARLFDEDNRYFQPNANLNKSYLILTQAHMNDLLQARGYVFLNEVYQKLGFEETEASRAVGWWLGADGDNEISFGFLEGDTEERLMFLRGHEAAVWLDFNVDGVILKHFPKF